MRNPSLKFKNWYFTKGALPYWCVLAVDVIIVMSSCYLGKYLELGGLDFAQNFWPITWGNLICVAAFVIFFRIFHTYAGVVRYSSFVDLQKVCLANILSCMLVAFVSFVFVNEGFDSVTMPHSRGVLVIFSFSTLMMWLVRVIVKSLFDYTTISHKSTRAFIYGVKADAVALANSLNMGKDKYVITGFISPDGDLGSNYLMGVKVRRAGHNLIKHIIESHADTVIVSPQMADRFRDDQNLVANLTSNGIKILMMPKVEEWNESDNPNKYLREVEIEDLLPRDKIEVDMDSIGGLLKGKSIMITGAAGSIGSEIVRQTAVYGPSEMVLVDQAETPMHDIRLMMAGDYPSIKAFTIVADISDGEFMEGVFREHRPDYVFHCAAYKHVPMMEDNPAIAVKNNVAGTHIIADLAVKYGTRKFVMISTDKAVNPTNVMGCSKRICEIYCQSLSEEVARGKVFQSDGTPAVTQFVTTRFGNVLGSNGSVIPLFRKQIQEGGPVTVTDPRIIRYFMLIPEACKLVLEAGTIGKGGEIFVFDMGQPVKIVELAKRMIDLSGAKNVEIKFTGLRDGEKLYEEVLADEETTLPTSNPKIMVASVRKYDYSVACANEERLLEAARHSTPREIVSLMQEIVPEYHPANRAYR